MMSFKSNKKSLKRRTTRSSHTFFNNIVYSILVGISVGLASAFFLISLDWVTLTRESNQWIIWLLPIGGLVIGMTYHYYGKDVVRGNNLLIEEYHTPKKYIPFKMAPFVLFGTLITHLFGGSAGREGTAVQMGGAISDQFSRWFGIQSINRKTLLIMGISAGFSGVFGTPIAAAIFSIEVLTKGKNRYRAIVPALLAAYIADVTCHFAGATHTHYHIPFAPDMTINLFLWTVLSGILFGITAYSFSTIMRLFTTFFQRIISYPPLRPVVGGIIIAICVYLMGTTKYIGLGIPTIVESFDAQLPQYDFLIKLLITAFTLSAGFKGGEVTPLFFIGATLGNLLFIFIPLPLALLAGMGFVAVFSGATNTPIACAIMGIELFGIEGGAYITVACVVAFIFSGKTGIYSAQSVPVLKQELPDILLRRKSK